MSKQRTSVSIDEDVAMYLQQDGVNASGLVNRLVKAEMGGADGDKQLIELRLEQVESQIESLQSQLEQKQRERERLKARLRKHQSEREEMLADAQEAISEEMRDPDNPAVETWAEKMNITTDELLSRLEG
jgi:chromosome segregation ATPase